MNYKEQYMKIPRPVWVVAGILGIALFVYGGFYLFDYREQTGQTTIDSNPLNTLGLNAVLEEERQQAVDWYETTISKLENRVDDMEKRTIEGQANMQENYQEHLTAMEAELDTLRSQVKQVRRATAQEWELLKTRVEETRARVEDKLQNDYRDFSVSID